MIAVKYNVQRAPLTSSPKQSPRANSSHILRQNIALTSFHQLFKNFANKKI